MDYIVRECTQEDYQDICDFFNRNNAYQVNDIPLNVEDVKLSFALKEMKHFYGLFYNGKLVGSTGLFDFIYEAKHFRNSIFSGFLLIDPTVRDGSAIKKLFFALQNNKNIEGKTYLCEINLENKASLQLSRLNGYVLYKDSWEDQDHYLLLRSDISKIENITNKFSSSNKIKYKFISAIWDKNSYFAKFLIDSNKEASFGIFDFNPWIVKTDRYYFKFYEDCLYWKFKDENLSFTILENDLREYNKISDSSGSIIVRKKNLSLKLYENNNLTRFYTLDNNFLNDTNNDLKFEVYESHENETIDKIKINKINGDITYYINNKEVILDVFPRINSSIISKVKIKRNDNYISISVINSNYSVTKDIFISKKGIKNKITFVSSKKFLAKYGLRFFHNNYYLNNETSVDYFFPYEGSKYTKNNDENDEFAKKDLFKVANRYYYFPEFDVTLTVKTDELSSNQMNYRPLILSKLNKNEKTIRYNIDFKKSNNLLENNSYFDNYELMKINIKRIYTRKEIDNKPAFVSTKVMSPLKSNYVRENNLLKIKKLNGLFTGVYFKFKIQGNIFACDSVRKLELHENGPWLEFPEYVIIINKRNKTYSKFYSKNSRFFLYKKHNTIYMRVVHENCQDIDGNIYINIKGR